MEVPVFLRTPLGLIFVVTACVAGACFFLKYKRKKLVEYMQTRPDSWGGLKFADKGLVFAGGMVLTVYKVTDPKIWSDHPIRSVYICFFAGSLIVAGWGADWLRERLKDDLKKRVIEAETRNTDLERVLKRWVYLVSQIRKLLESKLEQVMRNQSDNVSICKHQIRTIGQLIHQFVEVDLKHSHPEARLRMALYVPNANRTEMSVLHAWDGTTEKCISDHPDRMKLNHLGALSVITKTYYLPGQVAILNYSDCKADEDFHFFTQEQRSYLRSMFAMKYATHVNGTVDAVVLALDTNATGYFSSARAREFEQHLTEMMKRMDFEFSHLELALARPNVPA